MRKLLTWQQVGNDNSLPTVPHYEQQAVFYVQNVQYSLPFSGRVVHLTPTSEQIADGPIGEVIPRHRKDIFLYVNCY